MDKEKTAAEHPEVDEDVVATLMFEDGLIPQRSFRRNVGDHLLWLFPLLLSIVGVIMITSATAPLLTLKGFHPFLVGVRQGLWLLISLVACMGIVSVPLIFWRKISLPLWVLSVALAFGTLHPALSRVAGGASRWISLGPVNIQASEVLIFAFTMRLAFGLNLPEVTRWRGIVKTGILTGMTMAPLALQPDFGSMGLVFLIAAGMYVESHGWVPAIAGAALGGIGMAGYAVSAPYRMERIRAFLDPWADPLGKGFQTIQGLIAFSNGGLVGVGLGQGLQKMSHLPAAHTDFIFATIGEEFGFLGLAAILLMYISWAWRACIAYYGSPSPCKEIRSLLWGMTISVMVPLFIHVGGVTHTFPLTGAPAPFLSYGGSALLFAWMRVGVIMRCAYESVNLACPEDGEGDGERDHDEERPS